MSEPIRSAHAITITAFAQSDAGQMRRENQDTFLVADLSAASAEDGLLLTPPASRSNGSKSLEFELGRKGALALVADGMGGAAAGAAASKLAVTWIYYELLRRWGDDVDPSANRFVTLLRQAVESANSGIHEHAMTDPACRGMGTTATAVGIHAGCAYVAQVGDSRAYLIRGGYAFQLTRDQSVAQVLVESGLSAEEVQASGHANAILQALGAQPQVNVDLTYQELRRDDALLLCSDGLFRVVHLDELAHVVTQVRDPATACEALVRLANSRGGPDNVTAVIVRAAGPGLPEFLPGDSVGHKTFSFDL